LVLGEHCNLPQRGLHGRAPAEIVFGAFKPKILTSGGNNSQLYQLHLTPNDFTPNGDEDERHCQVVERQL